MPEPEKPESVPLVTVISVASKSEVLSEAVNDSDKFESFDVSPSLTSAAVMAMVGEVSISSVPLGGVSPVGALKLRSVPKKKKTKL